MNEKDPLLSAFENPEMDIPNQSVPQNIEENNYPNKVEYDNFNQGGSPIYNQTLQNQDINQPVYNQDSVTPNLFMQDNVANNSNDVNYNQTLNVNNSSGIDTNSINQNEYNPNISPQEYEKVVMNREDSRPDNEVIETLQTMSKMEDEENDNQPNNIKYVLFIFVLLLIFIFALRFI